MLIRTQTQTQAKPASLSPSKVPFYGAWLLRHLPFKHIQHGTLTVKIGEHQRHFTGSESGPHAELIINEPLRFIWRFSTQGELGFAKAYADNSIDTPCLYTLLQLGLANEQALSHTTQGYKWFYQRFLQQHRNNHNSLENSRENISAHYDLGNDFYQLWLDDTMSYSSALFKTQTTPLAEAQIAKYNAILHELNLKPNQRILEIGCGWGGFAEQAVKQGAEVTGITLSAEQLAFAKKRLAKQGLAQKAQLSLTDYRHQEGQFDHIVSIEMFEAVGKEYWHEYFTQLKRLLKKDGKAILQIITIDESRAVNYQDNVDFIQAFIFPGGLLPSKAQLLQLADEHGFLVNNELCFGQDYAKTLLCWQQQFNEHSETLLEMGYDNHFQRIWNYYFDYCRVGFETQCTDVIQLSLSHKS